MSNKSVQYAKAVVFGEIVAPSQVRQTCVNFLYEYFPYRYSVLQALHNTLGKIIFLSKKETPYLNQ